MEETSSCVESLRTVLKILGGKWPLMVIASLFDGPKRFNELNRMLDCNTKSLSDTLKFLEENNVVIREVWPTTPVTVEYYLTEKGQDLRSVVEVIGEWEKKWM